MCLCCLFSAKTSESKSRFFLQNESIRIANRNALVVSGVRRTTNTTNQSTAATALRSGILNRQSRAERQNTFDWLHILPVRVTINQYKSYSANGSGILPIKSYSASISDILPIGVTFCNHVLSKLSAV